MTFPLSNAATPMDRTVGESELVEGQTGQTAVADAVAQIESPNDHTSVSSSIDSAHPNPAIASNSVWLEDPKYLKALQDVKALGTVQTGGPWLESELFVLCHRSDLVSEKKWKEISALMCGRRSPDSVRKRHERNLGAADTRRARGAASPTGIANGTSDHIRTTSPRSGSPQPEVPDAAEQGTAGKSEKLTTIKKSAQNSARIIDSHGHGRDMITSSKKRRFAADVDPAVKRSKTGGTSRLASSAGSTFVAVNGNPPNIPATTGTPLHKDTLGRSSQPAAHQSVVEVEDSDDDHLLALRESLASKRQEGKQNEEKLNKHKEQIAALQLQVETLEKEKAQLMQEVKMVRETCKTVLEMHEQSVTNFIQAQVHEKKVIEELKRIQAADFETISQDALTVSAVQDAVRKQSS